MLTSFFSSYNLWYRVSISSKPWQNVITLSKFGWTCNILSFALSILSYTSKSSFNVIFLPVTSSETFSSFLSQSLFFIYIHKFAFTKFLRLYIYILHLMTTSWSYVFHHINYWWDCLPKQTYPTLNSWWSIICSTNLWNLGVKFTAVSLSALAALIHADSEMKPAFTGNENFFSLFVISFLSMQLGMNASQTDWDLFLLQFKLHDVEAILPYFLYSSHVFNTVHTKSSYRKSTCPIFTTCHYFQIFYNIQFFRSSISTFHFFDELPSLLVNSLLWLSSFVKCHMNLSLKTKR